MYAYAMTIKQLKHEKKLLTKRFFFLDDDEKDFYDEVYDELEKREAKKT